VKIRGEVISSTGVRDPSSLVRVRWCDGSHGNELCWRMSSLVCVIHVLIKINHCVPRLVTNLAGRTRTMVCIPRLGIL
jgi:hypothetical protein